MSNWNIICISVKMKSWRMVIHSKPHDFKVLLLYPVIVTCNLFTHEALNSFQCARAFQVERNLEVLVLRRRKKQRTPENPLGARKRTKNKPNPHMVLMPGFEPWPHGESGVLYSKCSNQRIMPLFYLHTAHLVIFFLGEGRGCLCEKKKDFKACFLGKQPSHFALPGPRLHVVKQWFAWILADWRRMLVYVYMVNRGDNHWQVKFNKCITKSKVPYHPCFVLLHKFCQNSKLTQN